MPILGCYFLEHLRNQSSQYPRPSCPPQPAHSFRHRPGHREKGVSSFPCYQHGTAWVLGSFWLSRTASLPGPQPLGKTHRWHLGFYFLLVPQCLIFSSRTFKDHFLFYLLCISASPKSTRRMLSLQTPESMEAGSGGQLSSTPTQQTGS